MTSDAATRLQLRISLSMVDAGAIAEMSVIGDFDVVEVERFDRAATVIPADVVEMVVDLTATTVIDSAALGSLIRLRRAVARSGGSFVVLITRPFQTKVMRVSGLWEHLGVRIVEEDGGDRR